MALYPESSLHPEENVYPQDVEPTHKVDHQAIEVLDKPISPDARVMHHAVEVIIGPSDSPRAEVSHVVVEVLSISATIVELEGTIEGNAEAVAEAGVFESPWLRAQVTGSSSSEAEARVIVSAQVEGNVGGSSYGEGRAGHQSGISGEANARSESTASITPIHQLKESILSGSSSASADPSEFLGAESEGSSSVTGEVELSTYIRGELVGDSYTANADAEFMPRGSYISFDYKVRSEGGYDFFEVYLDGVRLFRDSGFGSWTPYIIDNLAPGEHTLLFNYIKDFTVSAYEDTAYIDNISLHDDSGVYTESFETPDINPVFNVTGTWQRTDEYASDGEYSLRGDYITHNENTQAVFTFEVYKDPVGPPPTPEIVYPENNSTVENRFITVLWSQEPHPEGESLRYRGRYRELGTTQWTEWFEEHTGVTEVDLPRLDIGDWEVQIGTDVFGNPTEWSNVVTFSIYIPPCPHSGRYRLIGETEWTPWFDSEIAPEMVLPDGLPSGDYEAEIWAVGPGGDGPKAIRRFSIEGGCPFSGHYRLKGSSEWIVWFTEEDTTSKALPSNLPNGEYEFEIWEVCPDGDGPKVLCGFIISEGKLIMRIFPDGGLQLRGHAISSSEPGPEFRTDPDGNGLTYSDRHIVVDPNIGKVEVSQVHSVRCTWLEEDAFTIEVALGEDTLVLSHSGNRVIENIGVVHEGTHYMNLDDSSDLEIIVREEIITMVSTLTLSHIGDLTKQQA